MNKKKRSKKIKETVRFFVLSAIIICFVCVLIIIGKSSVQAETSKSGEICYKSIQIEAGDTLSSIASEYGMSVEEIRNINNMENNRIYAGDMLIVSYCGTNQ